MIMRYWRGWATPENADAYERVAREEIFRVSPPRFPGYRGSYLRDGRSVRTSSSR